MAKLCDVSKKYKQLKKGKETSAAPRSALKAVRAMVKSNAKGS